MGRWGSRSTHVGNDATRPLKTQESLALGGEGFLFSAPVGTRTPNLLIRNQMLYPIELQAQT